MIRINLLPVRAEKKKESLRQHVVIALGLLLVLAAGIGAVQFSISSQIGELETQIAQRRQEIARLKSIIGEVNQFRKKKRQLEEKIDVIAQLEKRQRGPVQVLYELTQIIPEKMWIEDLKDDGGALSVQGFAIDNQTIARFMTQMERSPRFSGVRLELTRQVTKGGVALKSFSIKASVVYAEAG